MMKKDNLFLHIKMDNMTYKLYHHIPKQQYTSTLMCVSYAGRKARLPK